MSDSVQPHRRQPTRLPCPWDSPGKNTGVGCHFLLQCMKVKRESEVAQSCPTLCDPMDCRLPDSSVHGIFQARVLEWGAIAFSCTNSSTASCTNYLTEPRVPRSGSRSGATEGHCGTERHQCVLLRKPKEVTHSTGWKCKLKKKKSGDPFTPFPNGKRSTSKLCVVTLLI